MFQKMVFCVPNIFHLGFLFEKLVLGPGDGFMLRRQLLTISKNASKVSHE